MTQKKGVIGLHDTVIKRLGSLGYAFDPADAWILNFLMEKVTNTIKNECNIADIPQGLMQVATDMVCGEFLLMKKGSGDLDGLAVDLNAAALRQIQEGDTNVVFAVDQMTTAEQRLDAVIAYLMHGGSHQLITYRRLKWT